MVNDISGQYIDRIDEVQATQEEFEDCRTLEEGIFMLSQNVCNQMPTYTMLTSQKNEGLVIVLLVGWKTRVCKRKKFDRNTQAKATY